MKTICDNCTMKNVKCKTCVHSEDDTYVRDNFRHDPCKNCPVKSDPTWNGVCQCTLGQQYSVTYSGGTGVGQ